MSIEQWAQHVEVDGDLDRELLLAMAKDATGGIACPYLGRWPDRAVVLAAIDRLEARGLIEHRDCQPFDVWRLAGPS